MLKILWNWLMSNQVENFVNKYEFVIKVFVVMALLWFLFMEYYILGLSYQNVIAVALVATFSGFFSWILFLLNPEAEYLVIEEKERRMCPLTLKSRLYQIFVASVITAPTYYFIKQMLDAYYLLHGSL